jgi:nitronate monooxygenase
MMAGVDYVLMGAGIPRNIPGVLDSLSEGKPTSLPITVAGSQPGEEFLSHFDPGEFMTNEVRLSRPKFLAIVSSSALAENLAKKASGKVDGFVVEGWTAGGHNAPPRGAPQLDDLGQPIYGPRDVPDLAKFRELGLPFWLAGSYGTPERYQEALADGAAGVQVGTAFAFSRESGIEGGLKAQVIAAVSQGHVPVRTDPRASPTGFPFKVVDVPGTLADERVAGERARTCDLGYLRTPYRMADGKVGYRCPAEDIEDYVRKGGDPADAEGRVCVCNGLMATIGLGQVRNGGYVEPMLVTAGDDIDGITRFLPEGSDSYGAADVIEAILGEPALLR